MKNRKIRYAVIGQGYFAQVAVLPAFKNARKNSELVALISDDETKLKKLGRKYGVDKLYGYDQLDECLGSGEIDALYIALPNHLHAEYATRAARHGVHVLCEKPMDVSSDKALEMIEAARANDVRLMIAYRLHFEAANLSCVDLIKKGRIGDAKLYNAVFTLPVKDENIRTNPRQKGGGPTYDIGIYCINAARYLFQAEPTEVLAMDLRGDRKRFKQIEESMAVTLRFPGDRVASFVYSFNAVPAGHFEVLGTKGSVRLDNAFEFAGEKKLTVNVKGKSRERKFASRDQVAPELLYFSECVIAGREPEPSGLEGLADLRIIEAIFESSRNGTAVKLEKLPRKPMPGLRQEISRPAVKEPELVHAEQPSKDVA